MADLDQEGISGRLRARFSTYQEGPPRRRYLLLAIVVVVLAFTGYGGYLLYYWHHHISTDDAYITALNPDDSGQLDYRRTVPVVGILFRVAPSFSIYGNAGAGFETPTFAELAYRNDGLSGLNSNLRAARSASFEFGFRSRREGLAAVQVAALRAQPL